VRDCACQELGDKMEYVIVRPGGLKSEPATGKGVLTEDNTVCGAIHREDLATLVVKSLISEKAKNKVRDALCVALRVQGACCRSRAREAHAGTQDLVVPGCLEIGAAGDGCCSRTMVMPRTRLRGAMRCCLFMPHVQLASAVKEIRGSIYKDFVFLIIGEMCVWVAGLCSRLSTWHL
jgi:NAD(P)H-binding